MTNDLRIVPVEPTDEMRKAIETETVIDDDFEVCNSWWVYEKTLAAAPDYSHLVIVERERLEELKTAIQKFLSQKPEAPLPPHFIQAVNLLCATVDFCNGNYGIMTSNLQGILND